MLSGSSVIVLRGGASVALEPWRLAIELEERGCRFRVDGEDLVVTPRSLLTDRDRAAIREWREDLKRIVNYCEDPQ